MDSTPPILNYRLWLKGKAPTLIRAFGHTQVPEEGSLYFHKKEDKSDRDAFFLLSEVIGFDPELAEPPEKIVTTEMVLEQFRRMREHQECGENSLYADNI